MIQMFYLALAVGRGTLTAYAAAAAAAMSAARAVESAPVAVRLEPAEVTAPVLRNVAPLRRASVLAQL